MRSRIGHDNSHNSHPVRVGLTFSIQNEIAELYSLLETGVVLYIIIIMRLRIGVVV